MSRDLRIWIIPLEPLVFGRVYREPGAGSSEHASPRLQDRLNVEEGIAASVDEDRLGQPFRETLDVVLQKNPFGGNGFVEGALDESPTFSESFRIGRFQLLCGQLLSLI